MVVMVEVPIVYYNSLIKRKEIVEINLKDKDQKLNCS
jgi:hypothetical protein